MFTDKYHNDRSLPADSIYLNSLLQQVVDHYRLIDKTYLDTAMTSVTLPYFGDGVRNRQYKRKHLLLYPDYMDGWFSWTYHSDLFFNFLDKNKLFEELYTTPQDLGLVHYWFAKANEKKPFMDMGNFDNNYQLGDETLIRILALAETHPQGKSLDQNLVCLILAIRAFDRNDVETGMRYYNRFDKGNFGASRDKYEYLEKTFFLNMLKDLCVKLALAGKHQEAVELAEKFEKDHEKAFAYIFMAEKLYMKNSDPIAFVYLDSVFSKSKEIDFSQFNFGANQAIDFRFNLILLMSRIGGKKLNSLSYNFLSDIIEQNKFFGVLSRVYGIAEEGNFYRALTAIPSTLTETEELTARSFIVWQACRKIELEEGRQRWGTMDEFITHDFNYIFFLPN